MVYFDDYNNNFNEILAVLNIRLSKGHTTTIIYSHDLLMLKDTVKRQLHI